MPKEKEEKGKQPEAQEEWKVRFKDGTVFAPVTYDTLLEWFKSGQIDAETPVAKNDLTAEWTQFKETEGFGVASAAKEGRKVFCTSCGSQWPEGTKFCTKCGTSIETGEKVLGAGERKPERVISLRRKPGKVSPEQVEAAVEEVPPQAEIQAPAAEQVPPQGGTEAGVAAEVAPAAEEAPRAAILARRKKRGKKKVIRLLVAVAAIVVGLAVFAPEQMSEILRKAKRLVGLEERGPGEKEKEQEKQKWVGVRADVRSAIDSVRERLSSALTAVPFADRQKEAFETEAAAFLRTASDEFTDTDAFISLATALADGELREAASFLEEEKSLLKAEATTPGIDAIQGAIQILLGREKKGLPLLASAVEQSDVKPVAASFCRGAVEGCLEKLLLPQGKRDPWGSVAEILGVNKSDLGEEFLARYCGKALLGMTALQGLSWAETRRASAGPAYRLASQNTSTTSSADGSTVVTRQLGVILSGARTEPEIRGICNEIIAEQVKFRPCNAILLSFYLPGTDASGPPTGGAAVWAPNGKWQNAGAVRAGDYSRHRLVIQPGAGVAAVSPRLGAAAGKPGGSRAGMFSRLAGAQGAGGQGSRIRTKSFATLFRRSDPSVQAALVELGKTDPAKRPSVLKHKAARAAYALSLISKEKRAEPGRDSRLLGVLKEGLSADPENAFYNYALAALYLRMKKDDEAIAEIAAGNKKPVCRDYSRERMAGLAKVLDTALPYTAAAMAISSPHLSALASSTRRLLDSAQSSFRVGKWAEVFEILGPWRIACVRLRKEVCTFSDALTVINAALPVMAAEAEFYRRDGKAAEAWRVRKTLAENRRLALAIEQAAYGPSAEIFVKEVLSEKGYEQEFSKSSPQKVLAGLWSKATGRLDGILGQDPATPIRDVNLQDRNYVAAKTSLDNQKHEMAFQYANACLAQNPKHLWAFKVMQEAVAKVSVEAELSRPKAVAYRVVGKRDLSLGGVKRLQYDIEVAKGTTKDQGIATARSALQGFWKREKADAVRIYVTPKGSLLPLVRLNWAPGGDWAKAKQDTPYSEFEEDLKVFTEGRP